MCEVSDANCELHSPRQEIVELRVQITMLLARDEQSKHCLRQLRLLVDKFMRFVDDLLPDDGE